VTAPATASIPATPLPIAVPPAPVAGPVEPTKQSINPWLFVPVLYFMQSLPNILVTETFGTAFKNLEVDNLQIALWSGLAALPWAFKMFWGPLVDLSFTKRQWTVAMQVLICGTLIVSASVMNTSSFFPLAVASMFILATFSATHDIACDGLYLMSLNRTQQAAFSGVMATFSRLGRFFAASVVVWVAGWIITRGAERQTAWAIALGTGALAYGAGMLWNAFMLPRPAADVPAVDVAPGERSKNVVRTLTIIAFGVALYYLIDATLQLIGYAIFKNVAAGTVPQKWDLLINSETNELVQQFVKLGVCVVALPLIWILIRSQVRGTAMGDAFVSYIRQPGFPAILAFIVFYRFGEAMVFAMAKLFIIGKWEEGGMGVSLQQYGAIQAAGQVMGLILGGLLGGWFISRVGLRRAFWPLVLCMHVPNVLYVWIAMQRPDPMWLYPVVFAEAFGYGFGFAGYFVYLMHVAQRGKYVTSHYAIGTGLGALFITFATITAGIIQSVFGYVGVFVAACLFTIPGTLTLLFIPMDEAETKKVKAASDH